MLQLRNEDDDIREVIAGEIRDGIRWYAGAYPNARLVELEEVLVEKSAMGTELE